ncbi:MAG: 50S ribosomal protein L24 [Sphaerochaeta sp.]|jgi:large subunit ribosomal protein L24|nr:50S ribosomal protein L24 [Sphaerochaeta sp.]MCH3920338.1 50S ribosomal protein L24 [Sphaerochaeta sp.]MCI2045054.1 50S ribosomal protein L24 [Sphaerochaeta sp.]MCI2076117.1 50S ribosomal protein L24 [Sphaerochaeta sp.]MCI2096844.1 50S ribosomal protein L24 [Sphaerochaeta sp.]
MRLKKNDTVKVISGKDKGKTGRILSIDHDKERVVVQGVNMVKKTMKKKNQQDKGGIIEIEAPLSVANVAYVLKDGKTTRIGYKFDDNGNKVRVAKKTGEVI